MAWISSTSSSVHEAGARVVDRGARADERDHGVERVERLEQTEQDVRALLGLAQAVARTTDDDLDLVRDPVPHEPVERERARDAVDQRDHVAGEVVLQLRVLVEVVEHDLRDGVALELDDQAHAGARRGVVADVGDAGDLALVGQLGDAQQQVVGVDLVGQLRDDEERATAVVLLDLDLGAHHHRAATGAVGVLDPLAAHDESAGGEVRALHPLEERLEHLLAARPPGARAPTARPRPPRRGCAAGCWWPCRPRCRRCR